MLGTGRPRSTAIALATSIWLGAAAADIMIGVIEHLRAAWDEMIAPGGPFAMSEIEVRGIPTRVFDAAPRTCARSGR